MAIPPVVALEIGTTKVIAFVGEIRDDGHMMITGMGEHPSAGVRKGEIIDLENAVTCVRSVLARPRRPARSQYGRSTWRCLADIFRRLSVAA